MTKQVGKHVRASGRGGLALVVCSLAALVAAAPASAGTLDQSQNDTSSLIAFLSLDRAQTFTAGLTGKLDQVDLAISKSTDCAGDVTVEIRTPGPDGYPTGATLASSTIPSAGVPDSASSEFMEVVFSDPADVVAGTVYAIFVSGGGQGCFVWSGSAVDPYPRGVAQSRIQGNWESHERRDYGFRTYVAPPRCHGQAATIVGTAAGEEINGTAGDDVIVGRGGDDRIDGKAGDDRICAGGGDDRIAGAPGEDTIFGQAGEDELGGGSDADTIRGGADDDRIASRAGDDVVLGGGGGDRLHGGLDEDVIRGGIGADISRGGADDDRLAGGAGNDLMRGGAGKDKLGGGVGHDGISGGKGEDRLAGHVGDDLLSGRAGDDLLLGHAGDDVLQGGPGNDSCFGGPGANSLKNCE